MYKSDLALNDLQWLIGHKTKPNQTKPYMYERCHRSVMAKVLDCGLEVSEFDLRSLSD